jgi:exopolyphosphatase/guanosine-5'-triphosphate,3'-diphosphate pyrophosphatase
VVAAVVDVGSNTIRLLVARRKRDRLDVVRSERVRIGLGADVELLGQISELRLRTAAKAVRKLCALARNDGAVRIDVLVTSPGRQATNAEALVTALAQAAAGPVRVLSAEEEGLLAFAGALASRDEEAGLVAVCDLGGASTELVVGMPTGAATWLRSVDLGALRLTTRFALGERPTAAAVEAAKAEAARCFAGVTPPLPGAALAVGGSARALRKLIGSGALGRDELAHAIELLETTSFRKLARASGVELRRLRLLLGGAVILAEVQRRVVMPLEVVEAGLREATLLQQLDVLAA